MAHLKRVRIRDRTYYYVVQSVRRGDAITKKVLQYLGPEPDPARVKRALAYWEEETMAKRKYGARVIRLDDKVAVVKQTFKAANDPTDRYKIDIRDGEHREAMVKLSSDREIAKAVRAALDGKL